MLLPSCRRVSLIGKQSIRIDGGGGEGAEAPPELDGAQEAPGEGPAAPQAADNSEAALEAMMKRSTGALTAETGWLAESLPEEQYQTGMAIAKTAASCLEAAAAHYLAARALANEQPADTAEQAAAGTAKVGELRATIADEIMQALQPQPTEMHRLQTAVVEQLSEADRLALAAGRTYDRAGRGEKPEPTTEVMGRMKGGGGGEDKFTKERDFSGGGFHSEMTIEGSGFINAKQNLIVTTRTNELLLRDDEILLKCGDSSLSLTPAGIVMKGNIVAIQANTVAIESAGVVSIKAATVLSLQGVPVIITGPTFITGSTVTIKSPDINLNKG